ncbi:putative ABC transporter ATP-binding protein [Nostocoides japonicum T1-X7]|uniref:Putative ABC transporter ATP-binding protein n=1 Tax=Nostocoides japonicum T1-X7 TaxID=1194083 RepID=A0A077M0C4_9MICO|nr:ABC transporter ATP-binding protein [Tetrasphaera japonica]CCH79311.1 putative ABC transporter ATP-binding protein [Tetrasphaera japonica T1-X7]
MTKAIVIEGLSKRYGDKRAVDGLDLVIGEGECFALLGPNGAGKTTTVEILEGFRQRDAGDVRVLGEDPGVVSNPRGRRGRASRAEWLDRIGIVLQGSGGLDLLTPREALSSTALAYSRPRPVEEVIAAVGLEEKADQRIAGLSGGQRRRLDVALGIIGRPELLFLDEPTTGFDPKARRDFWGLIASLRHDGTTILLTTHYLDEAEHLADRVGVVAAGRLLALDTPENLGGRAGQDATVTWEEGGRRHSFVTARPTRAVADLTARLATADGEVPELTVTRPSLEDTYLSLIAPHVVVGDDVEGVKGEGMQRDDLQVTAGRPSGGSTRHTEPGRATNGVTR